MSGERSVRALAADIGDDIGADIRAKMEVESALASAMIGLNGAMVRGPLPLPRVEDEPAAGVMKTALIPMGALVGASISG